MFSINPQLTSKLVYVGREKTPILVIDNFMLEYKGALDEACQQGYSTDKNMVGDYYPGQRKSVGTDYGMAVLKQALGLFYQVFKVPHSLTLYPQNGSYSLITKHSTELELLQCIPHFDNNDTFSFALLHYLNQGDFGGTGFYQHIPTGFENITADRKQPYLQSAQQFMDTYGMPSQGYITESTNHYRLIHKIDYKPNRLVIYPATLLHSAYIENPQHDVCADPKKGRLSANFFINFKV